MSGTVIGSKRAARTNMARYGGDFYRRIAVEHWQDPEQRRNHKPGGFYVRRDLARVAGSLGGAISRRGYKLTAREKQQIRSAYKELLAVHKKAQRERERRALHTGV